MAELTLMLRLRVLARSLAIQGSWNFRTMLGAGTAFALIPLLSSLFKGDREALARAVGRHAGFFNAHPYMASVAIGALARMEFEAADQEEIQRFRNVLVGPLGSLGDRLVWARWRPLCSIFAVLLVATGAVWWVAAGLFLLLYNSAHLSLRAWGLGLGWREGRRVGAALRASPLRRLPDRLTIPLAVISGLLLPPLALAIGEGSGVEPISLIGISLILAAAGYWRPATVGRAAALILVLGSLVMIVLANAA